MESSSARAVVRDGWTLRERLEAARERAHEPAAADDEGLAAWVNAVAPDQAINWHKRLEWSGNSIDDAAWAVNPRADAVPDEPSWLPVLEGLQQACRHGAPSASSDATPNGGRLLPFDELWQPVGDWALHRLCSRLPAGALERVAPEALRCLRQSLLARLSRLTDQALYDLFCEYRGSGASLLASLGGGDSGESPPARDVYRAFVERHRASGLTDVLDRYPVLGRLLATAVQQWFEAGEELLRRLHRDRVLVADVFGIAAGARLIRIDLDLSDPHRGGRSVAALHFASEDMAYAKIVYKPRDMRVDAAYQAFLRGLNELAGEPRFRVLAVLARDGYGFMEYVDYRPCRDERELEAFYRNAGRLLAVLYVLGCTDCHNENLIAGHDQLVLIDVETLLQGDAVHAAGDVEQKLAQSVMRVGLLPRWLFKNAGGHVRALDSSALGIAPPPSATIAEPGWVATNSDRMHWGNVERQSPVPASCPVAVARPDVLATFARQICDGFAEQMRTFLHHANDLLAPGALLARFGDLPRRVVLRPTQVYAAIQLQALQPDALRDAVVYGAKLEQLSRRYVISDEKPRDWAVFESELRQMEQLDVPYFEQTIGSDVLHFPDGSEPIAGFLRTSGLSACRERLERLDEADIAFQLQLVRGAIEAHGLRAAPLATSGRTHAPLKPGAPVPATDLRLSREQRLTEALRLATQLQHGALRGGNGSPEWLGLDLGPDGERFVFGLVGPSLYGGRTGIALFLSVLAQRLERDGGFEAQARALRDDARAAMSAVLETAASDDAFALSRSLRDQPLGLTGTGGLLLGALALDRSGLRPQSGTYTELAKRLAAALTAARIHDDTHLDVTSGCAGLIGPLLMLAGAEGAARRGDSAPFALAIACGDRIVAQQTADGAWPNADAKRSLTGFSHGAAGISAALARLHRMTGADRFLTAARRGLDYERTHFVAARGNWPDFRTTGRAERFMNTWCHGAPGIALSRLCLRMTSLWDERAHEELAVAFATTLQDDVHVDQLCCGEFGRAAILDVATACGLGTQWVDAAGRMRARSVRAAERRDGAYRLFSAVDAQVNVPGLFTGSAGIGLGLLAADDPRVAADCLSCGLLGTTDVP